MILNRRQKAFCKYYVVDFRGAESARKAGYGKGASVRASEMLNDPVIQNYIKYLLDKKVENDPNLEVTPGRVLKELSRIAFHDPGSYFKIDDEGSEVPKTIHELTPDQRAAITDYDTETKKIKLASKDPSLDKLGKHLKLFTELHDQITNFTVMGTITLDGKELEFNVGNPISKK